MSIVKNSPEFLDCSDRTACRSWVAEIDGKPEDEAKTMLGLVDTVQCSVLFILDILCDSSSVVFISMFCRKVILKR